MIVIPYGASNREHTIGLGNAFNSSREARLAGLEARLEVAALLGLPARKYVRPSVGELCLLFLPECASPPIPGAGMMAVAQTVIEQPCESCSDVSFGHRPVVVGDVGACALRRSVRRFRSGVVRVRRRLPPVRGFVRNVRNSAEVRPSAFSHPHSNMRRTKNNRSFPWQCACRQWMTNPLLFASLALTMKVARSVSGVVWASSFTHRMWWCVPLAMCPTKISGLRTFSALTISNCVPCTFAHWVRSIILPVSGLIISRVSAVVPGFAPNKPLAFAGFTGGKVQISQSAPSIMLVTGFRPSPGQRGR